MDVQAFRESCRRFEATLSDFSVDTLPLSRGFESVSMRINDGAEDADYALPADQAYELGRLLIHAATEVLPEVPKIPEPAPKPLPGVVLQRRHLAPVAST